MMLAPLQTLVETKRGQVVRLPEKLQRLYGTLRLPRARRRGGARGGPQGVPYVFSNFVSTLDGVVSLGIQGHDGGGDISGFSVQDRMVMGLLRAVADVVIVGGGSLAAGRGGAGGGALSARAILDAVRDQGGPCQRVLIEGGPRLLGSFYAERLIDEQFLTLSPQLAGREVEDERISLVMGKLFTPKDPRWATLVDVRRGGSHLFLRYGFANA